jgi:hypothetical protein
MNGRPQVVDPAVSREKFDHQVAEFRRGAELHRRRGWWLLEAEFPTVLVAMAAPQVRPPAVVCGVRLDFTNYDLEPPSVVLVDPFTSEPYRAASLPTVLPRTRATQVQVPNGPVFESTEVVPLMQAHGPEEIPFLCIPGVREYHSNPAHTGDSWLAHRGQGEGTLFSILNTIHTYGVQTIAGYQLALQVVGFRPGEAPV